MPTTPNQYSSDKFQFMSFLSGVFTFKLIIFSLDPTVMFFQGDSCSYIHTAIAGWLPPDRSFLYGYIIRWISLLSHSLTSIVFIQVICSGFVAIFIGYILNVFFSVNRKIALLFSVFCALDPLQLMYERYVMTETLSLFIFMWYVVFSFHYLYHPRILLLIPISIFSALLISLRLSFLPVVMIWSIFLPLLSYYKELIALFHNILNQFRGKKIKLNGTIYRIVILNFLISIILNFGCLELYKRINGILKGAPPAFQYSDGLFLAAAWAPVILKEDIPQARYADFIIENLPCDLKDRQVREEQRWLDDCLIGRIKKITVNEWDANKLGRDISLNALKRDPFGVLKLSCLTFLDFWDFEILKSSLHWDRGERPLSEDFIKTLDKKFNLAARNLPKQKTLTNKFFFSSYFWYYILLTFPFIIVGCLFVFRKNSVNQFLIYLGMTYIIILAVSVCFVTMPVVRYLHPLGPIALMFLGVITGEFVSLKTNMKRKTKRPASVYPSY